MRIVGIRQSPAALLAGDVARDAIDCMVGPNVGQLLDFPFVGVELLGESVRILFQQSVTYIHYFARIN
jgi:hypothetical protein